MQKPIVGLTEVDLQLGNEGLGLLEGARGLVDVQFVDLLGLEAGLGDLESLLLQLHVGLGQFDLPLGGAKLHVSRGRVGQQRDQHVVVVFDRGVQVGVCGLDRPAEAAPEIQFPGETKTEVPLLIETLRDDRLVGHAVAQAIARVIPGGSLRLRKQAPHRDASLGSGLQHPEAGLAQGQVLAVGTADQDVERRVVEDGPPMAQVVRGRPDTPIRGIDPVHRHGSGRPGVVRSDLESVVDVFLQGGTTTHQHRQAHEAGAASQPGPRGSADRRSIHALASPQTTQTMRRMGR